jgi:malate dehydrogenase (oxaloacetate-decarboxylating)(NADP+)
MSKTDALRYHSEGRPGKIEVVPTKPCLTQRDLSLAYSPGVAEPCLEIAARPDAAFEYTAKANLVAVISNGTAVLGLGDIGPLAGKPVMEGKGVLFKKFADIDVFDLEINEKDPQKLIEIIAALEPTFGGINLEDIKAPECFVVEKSLKERMQIPVFHDDQHGTAIISAAALLNAAELQGKKIPELKIAVSGAGASAISCMNLWRALGVQVENILMCDSKGVLYEGRQGSVDATKVAYVRKTAARTLAEAMKGADVFVGLSKADCVTPEMVQAMADRPIVFALANPNPEIPYDVARAARPDAVIGTGRSDYPNQVNNVLGFPYIFRGALDVGARQINDPMKLAAVHAIAALAHETVPDRVRAAYGGAALRFGRDYILPKPVDERVLLWVAPAVAGAAMKTGVARRHLELDQYRAALDQRFGPARSLIRQIVHRVAHQPKRIAFASAEDERVLRSLPIVVEEHIAQPVVIGDETALREKAASFDLKLDGVEFIGLRGRPTLGAELSDLLAIRGRRGMTGPKARSLLESDATVAGLMMVRLGQVDGLVAGLQHGYPETIRFALQLVGPGDRTRAVAGVHIIVTKRGPVFFADTTVNISPDAETLVDIALMTARFARDVGVEPHVALLSFANFGSSSHPEAKKVADAVRMIREREPSLDVEGEMQVQIALDPEARARTWPQSTLRGEANVLVFPNLGAGNTAYQLMARMGSADEIGPVLLGLRKPVTVVPPACSVETIVQMTAMTALQSLTLSPAAVAESGVKRARGPALEPVLTS